MSRQESTKIEKTQVPKQMPVVTVQGTPSSTDLANMNPKTIIHDETNNIVYFKGDKFTTKVTGVRV